MSLFRNWLLSQVAASLMVTFIPQERPISNDYLMEVYKSLDPPLFQFQVSLKVWPCCLWDWLKHLFKGFTVQNFPLPSTHSLTPYCALPEHPSQQTTCTQISLSRSFSCLIAITSYVLSFLYSRSPKSFHRSEARMILKCKSDNVTLLHGCISLLKI